MALCRERCASLDEAIHQRYALAEAHFAYIHSLKGIGNSLHKFVEQDLANNHRSSSSPGSPPPTKLNLPPQRKGDPDVHHAVQASKSAPHPHSDAHLEFHSDSDSDDSGSLHHSDDDHDHLSPLHGTGGHYGQYMESDQGNLGPYAGGFMHMNFMKNKATPSVVYEQRPLSPETVYHVGESSSSTSYYPYNNNYMNTNPNPYLNYGYPNYDGGIGGYYGGSTPTRYGTMSPAPAASSSKPPPPPSPPRASPWEFLNPFETNESYYSQYTPSRDSREVREEEGIPDLEEEDYQHEVVKEVHGHQKFAGDGGKNSKSDVDNKVVDEPDVSLYQTRPSVLKENERGVEYEVHVVDKKVVDDEERSKGSGGGSGFKGRGGSRDVFEVVREIEAQFQRASESGNEIAQILEVGKLPYGRKHGMDYEILVFLLLFA